MSAWQGRGAHQHPKILRFKVGKSFIKSSLPSKYFLYFWITSSRLPSFPMENGLPQMLGRPTYTSNLEVFLLLRTKRWQPGEQPARMSRSQYPHSMLMLTLFLARGAGDACDFAGAAAVLAGWAIYFRGSNGRGRHTRGPVHLRLMFATTDSANRTHLAHAHRRAFAVFFMFERVVWHFSSGGGGASGSIFVGAPCRTALDFSYWRFSFTPIQVTPLSSGSEGAD